MIELWDSCDPNAVPPAIALAQNNRLRLFSAQGRSDGTHPLVYIENGSHEFWPTNEGGFRGARNHNGDGLALLVATPPNLGEVEFPLPEAAAAQLVLQFNGQWGALTSTNNDPPQGPPLHGNWLWPINSVIRPQLPDNMGY
jgi:hypothetical protein